MEQFVLLLAVVLWSEMSGVTGDTRVTNTGHFWRARRLLGG